MQELFDTIDALMPFTAPLVAIDGPCGGGKIHLGQALAPALSRGACLSNG